MSNADEALIKTEAEAPVLTAAIEPETANQEENEGKISTLPPQAVRMLMELTEMRASFGPDPETAKVFAETERFSEARKLEGFIATLNHKNLENERKHERAKMRLNHENKRAWAVLLSSVIAAAFAIYFSMTGHADLGIPMLVFAGILIKDLSGKTSHSPVDKGDD